MDDWHDRLDTTLAQVWATLGRGVADRRAPARHPTLATVAQGGGAEARTVVLRGASESEGRVELHSDSQAAKVAELRAEPRATLHMWDARQKLQIRLRLTVRILAGPEAAEAWARVPAAGRTSYGGEPPPGAVIGAPAEHRAEPRLERFAVLDGRVEEIETLVLAEPHRRARFRRADGWQGGWRAP